VPVGKPANHDTLNEETLQVIVEVKRRQGAAGYWRERRRTRQRGDRATKHAKIAGADCSLQVTALQQADSGRDVQTFHDRRRMRHADSPLNGGTLRAAIVRRLSRPL
jgi:hypothetical protein